MKVNLYIRRKYSFKTLINRKVLKCRQAFTMTNNMASSGNAIHTKLNAYPRWPHWLYEEKHLVPGCKGPNWWCCRTPYLPIAEVVDTGKGGALHLMM